LGGRAVFVAWHTPQGVESRDATYTFTVQNSVPLVAEWSVDNSQPMTIIAVAAGAIVVLLAVLTLYRTGHLLGAKAKVEPTDLEKAKAEVESLKGELEDARKRRVTRRKKPPPEEPHT
jgi:hypothetical protein